MRWRPIVPAAVIWTLLGGGCGGDRELEPSPPPPVTAAPAPAPRDAAPPPTMGQVSCEQVAAHVTALSKRDIDTSELAPPQKRTARSGLELLAGEVVATCKRVWNDDVRTCLLMASDKEAIRRCRRHITAVAAKVQPAVARVGATNGDCDAVIAHFLGLATRELAASTELPAAMKGPAMAKVAQLGGLLGSMCRQGWPAAFKMCVRAAKTVADLEPCRKHMPASLQKLEDRLTP